MAGTRTFHSKVGWVYWGVIAIFAAFLFFGFWDRSWVAILVCVAFEVWLIDEMVHTRYVITEERFSCHRIGTILQARGDRDIADCGSEEVEIAHFFSRAFNRPPENRVSEEVVQIQRVGISEKQGRVCQMPAETEWRDSDRCFDLKFI